MSENKRKYYRVTVHRYPPYSSINGSYYFEEDVRANTPDGARKSVERYHKKGYGDDIPGDVREITKEEFRGLHETRVLPKEETA